MRKKFVCFIFLSTLFLGCTRDDICPDSTATTPMLIIRFKDINRPDVLKEVTGLSVETDYENSIELFSMTKTDSIALPLNINSDTTRFKFIRTTKRDTVTISKVINKVEFIYQRQELYVNRACGFKMQFNDLDNNIIPNPPNLQWVQEIKVLRETVNDESNAHITILH